MKKVYFAVAASLVLSVSCFASSISLGSERPAEAGASSPRHAAGPSHDIRSAKEEGSSEFTESISDSNHALPDCDEDGGLACSTLIAFPLTSPANTAGSSLGVNASDPEVALDLGKNATPTAEPSSLLFLAVGLLFLPLLRKRHAARKSLRLRMA